MAIASRSARAIGIEFGVTDAARHALVAQEREGRANADYSAVIRSFFPQDGSLKTEQSTAEPSDDQPTLSGLDARTGGDLVQSESLAVTASDRTRSAVAEGDEHEPIKAGVASQIAAENGTAQVGEPAAALLTTEVAAPVASSREQGAEAASSSENGGVPVAVEAAIGEEQESSPVSGGLFRRFVRRGAAD
jgi:hypothetical protein